MKALLAMAIGRIVTLKQGNVVTCHLRDGEASLRGCVKINVVRPHSCRQQQLEILPFGEPLLRHVRGVERRRDQNVRVRQLLVELCAFSVQILIKIEIEVATLVQFFESKSGIDSASPISEIKSAVLDPEVPQ